METTDATAGLSFERATYSAAGGGTACANCKGPIGEQYWHWQSQAVCEGCRGRLKQIFDVSQSRPAFTRALLLGGATAFGCGVLYAVFVALTKYQLALVTIGIGIVIAKVMRKCSAGVGGRRFQVLAVVLTYLAAAMGYAPGVYGSFKAAAEERHGQATGVSNAQSSPSSPASPAPRSEKAGAGSAIIALAFFLAITLAAPVLAATEAPIGLLIVGFGLWEAWRFSRGIPLSLDGPYRAAPATGPPSP